MEMSRMKPKRAKQSAGFALIMALLLLFLMSVLAIGVMTRVRTEAAVSGNDLQYNAAFHAAEGGIEKMTSDLSGMFVNVQSPQISDYTQLDSLQPSIPGAKFTEYSVVPSTDPITGKVKSTYGQIQSGPNQGLYAQLLPVTLSVTAQTGLANEVRMVRTAEVALIPVFQFGVFSQGDLGFFSSPTLDFNGRVHTNGDVYLGVSSGSTITFHDKISAYGNVIRKVLPNGLDAISSSYNDSGTVKILAQAGGCDGSKPNCVSMSQSQGSVQNGPTSAQNGSWNSISTGTYNGWIINGNYGKTGGTGASCLSLPFTTGSFNCPSGPGQVTTSSGAQPYEIIRQPPAGEATTSAVSQARLYNEAEIRVLLADSPDELPGGVGDPQNIRLANVQSSTNAPDYSHGVPTSVASGLPGTRSGQPYVTYFAEASTAVQDPGAWTDSSTQTCLPADWNVMPTTPAPTSPGFSLYNYGISFANPTAPVFTSPATRYAPYIQANPSALAPPNCFATPAQIASLVPLSPVPAAAPSPPTTWNLVDGYLRVEYKGSDGSWSPVTREWLELGFARGLQPPTATSPNPVNPNAILLLQKPADRDANGSLDSTGATGAQTSTQQCTGRGRSRNCTTTVTASGIARPPEVQIDSDAGNTYTYGDKGDSTSPTRYNWYPLNFYDAREGEARDIQANNDSCTANGVMSAVEIDVNNLRKWLAGTIGSSGTFVDSSTNNGYILYFSDRRGMLSNTTAGRKNGDSGLEDVVNASSSAGTNDNALESPGGNASPEDVDLNGVLDNYGAADLGLGSGLNTAINATSTPNYYARISSCLSTGRKNYVSGARHVLKLVDGSLGSLPTKPDGTGGFTVASENPVYIQGDYNTSSADPTWNSTTAAEPAHAAAAIIADAVTVLSNNWNDTVSMGANGKRPTVASDRPASTTYYRVAIAAGKNRAFPAPSYSQNSTLYGFGTDGGVHNFLRFLEDWSSSTLYYKGSLVSLYYSTYATGTFKCCGYAVYQPPNRNYAFDPLFSSPDNLPPGTPMFRDVNNLSYSQDFTPR